MSEAVHCEAIARCTGRHVCANPPLAALAPSFPLARASALAWAPPSDMAEGGHGFAAHVPPAASSQHAARTGFPGFPSSRWAGARRQDEFSGILVFPACWLSLASAILPDFGHGWADLRRFSPSSVGSGRAPGPFPGARGPCPQPALFLVEGRRCLAHLQKLAGAGRISRRRDPESLIIPAAA